MKTELKPNQARRLRLRAQNLNPRGGMRPAAVVQHLVGVQAQEPMAAWLAIRVRSRNSAASQVDYAREQARTLVRTWSLRGTLHLHAAVDLSWLLPLLGPIIIRKSRRRFAELGLSEAIYNRARPAMEAFLAAEGPMTRTELAAHLSSLGIPTMGQAAYHLVRRAGLEGRLCYGPDRAGEPTFALLKDWVKLDGQPEEGASLGRLAHRYLAGYGPAQPEDFAAWSGLPLTSARTGFESLAEEIEAVWWDDNDAWLLTEHLAWLAGEPPGEKIVTLLPGYDPYLLGYRSRDLMVAPTYARRIHPGGGTLRPTLLVDGRAAGTWSSRRRTHDLVVQVEPFEDLDEAVLLALKAEVEDLGNFLETETVLQLVRPGN